MPSPKSRECWNPAVPPPPVAGAAVGIGLAVGEGLGVGLIVGLGDGLAVGLGLAVGVTLGVTVGVGELVAPGEIAGGVAAGVDPEQAETAAEASIAKAAQQTVNLARRPVPMMVVRIFMAPPHAAGRWRTRFPVSSIRRMGKGGGWGHRYPMACSSLQ